MTDNRDLCVEVRHQDIVVTMPDTSFRVVYRKPHRGPQLVAAQFRAALSCPFICRLTACLSVPLACMCRHHQRPRICQCHR